MAKIKDQNLRANKSPLRAETQGLISLVDLDTMEMAGDTEITFPKEEASDLVEEGGEERETREMGEWEGGRDMGVNINLIFWMGPLP